MKTLRFLVPYLLLFAGSVHLYAQDITQIGILPRINYLRPINEHFSLNFTAFSEIDPADNRIDDTVLPAKVLNLTFVGGVAYKLNLNSVITTGYLFRIIDPFRTEHREEHRIISQFVQFQHFGSLRLRHHLRFEQRFIEAINTSNDFNAVTRLSYSLGWDIPLQGKHLNANEFYLNSLSSYFVQPTKPRTAFNNLTEFYLALGFKTENIGRFEIGPEAKIAVRNNDKDLNAVIFIDFVWYPDFKKKKNN